jgi:cell division protein FtsQ
MDVGALFGPFDRWLKRRARQRARRAVQETSASAINWARWGIRSVVAMLVCFVLGVLVVAMDRPVQRVVVEGTFQRVRSGDVERVVRRGITGGFVTANLRTLRTQVESLAWVDRARLQRRWPNGVVVSITEQVAAARWGVDGLLNARGELFVVGVQHPPPELPVLAGPVGSEWQVAQRFFAVQSRLAERNLRVAAMRLDARGAWELELVGGVVVRFGRRQVDERIQRFLDVAAGVVQPRTAEITYVDMRYSNGFSIGWRTRDASATKDGQADV